MYIKTIQIGKENKESTLKGAAAKRPSTWGRSRRPGVRRGGSDLQRLSGGENCALGMITGVMVFALRTRTLAFIPVRVLLLKDQRSRPCGDRTFLDDLAFEKYATGKPTNWWQTYWMSTADLAT